jgi:prepilin peptidase CpaA
MKPVHMALVVASLACVSDLRTRRIPNMLTFGSAIAAIAVHGATAGTSGLITGVAGWLVGIALFFPLFALGGMGAGDVKLLGALGAWLGPMTVLYVALYSSMAGGVLAVAVALKAGYLRQAIRNLQGLACYWMTVGLKPAPGLTLDQEQTPKLAFAVPVLAGLMVTLWLK